MVCVTYTFLFAKLGVKSFPCCWPFIVLRPVLDLKASGSVPLHVVHLMYLVAAHQAADSSKGILLFAVWSDITGEAPGS